MSKIILLLALLPSCTAFDDHWNVDILTHGNSYIITSDLAQSLQSAQTEICENSLHCPDFSGGKSRLHFVNNVPNKTNPNALGNFRDGVLWISKIPAQPVVRLTLLHEFGHIYGCKHSDNPNDVMFSSLINNPPEHYSDADLECMGGSRNEPETLEDCEFAIPTQ